MWRTRLWKIVQTENVAHLLALGKLICIAEARFILHEWLLTLTWNFCSAFTCMYFERLLDELCSSRPLCVQTVSDYLRRFLKLLSGVCLGGSKSVSQNLNYSIAFMFVWGMGVQLSVLALNETRCVHRLLLQTWLSLNGWYKEGACGTCVLRVVKCI